MDKDIVMFTQPPQNGWIPRVLLDIKVTALLHMVEMGASQILQLCHPDSPDYITAVAYPGDSFDHLAKMDNRLMEVTDIHPHMRGDWGQRWYVNFWVNIDLLTQYVSLINLHPDLWHIGEEGFTRHKIYSALRIAHNWRVRCIEATHREQGKNFGSATGWQKFNFFKQVEDWPTRYPEHVRAGEVLILPAEREGYMDEEKQ